MADGDLDLQRGRGDDDEPRPRSERSQRRDRAREREKQGDISRRLSTIFTRLAQSLEGRGDDELATMIREDADAMVGGLVSMTRRVPAAAGAIVAGLAVLEPLIAFGRILRLLARRAGERRAEAWEEGGQEPPGEPGEQVPLAEEEEPTPIAEPWRLT